MLTRLYAHNFRCLVNFEFRPKKSSLLLGYNGAGKTTVFDVLRSIQSIAFLGAHVVAIFPRASCSQMLRSPEQRFELDIETHAGPMRYALVLLHDVNADTCAIKSEALTLSGKQLYAFSNGQAELLDAKSQQVRTFPHTASHSFLPSIGLKDTADPIAHFLATFGAFTILKLDPLRMEASSKKEDPFIAGDGSNFASWCRQLLQENPEHVLEAQTRLGEVITGFQRLKMVSEGRAKTLVAVFASEGKEHSVDFDGLSDGQKVLIVMYVVLCALVHDDGVPVLCLDEPENFVSIREIQPFLVELANRRDAGRLQTMIISHSPEVMDFIGAEEAVLLERPDGGATRVGTIPTNSPLKLSEIMARGWHGKP